MRLSCLLVFVLVTSAITLSQAKKKKKQSSKPKSPKWKQTALGSIGKKYMLVDEGRRLVLNCRAKGKPRPKVEWFFDEIKITEDQNTRMTKSGELTMTDVDPTRAGNYKCIARNSQGEKEWTLKLQVNKKQMPLVVDGPSNVTAMAGTSAIFRCRVLNNVQASIRWYKGRVEDRNFLDSDADDDKETYVLTNVQRGDEGQYGCLVSDVMQKNDKDAWLRVTEPIPPTRTTDSIDWRDEFDKKQFIETYQTTRKPKNRNGGGKTKGKNRNNKNKKNRINGEFVVDFDMGPPTTAPISTTSTTAHPMIKESVTYTDRKEVWTFHSKTYEPDERSRSKEDPETAKTEEPNGEAKGKEVQGNISSWTIYTVVGAVGGVILLIGLVAITLTLCCKREGGGVYKNTPV